MTRDELIARLLEVRAESQRSVDLCRSFERLGIGAGPANDRLRTRFERHVEAIDRAIAFVRGAS